MDSPSPCSSRRGSYTPVTSSSAASTSLGNTKVSDLKLILVNAVVAGLEIASSVAFTFIPPLLLKSGYSETQMTIIFGVGKTLFFTVRVRVSIVVVVVVFVVIFVNMTMNMTNDNNNTTMKFLKKYFFTLILIWTCL